MALASAQVVDALATRITGLALAGANVFTSRAWPLAEGDLPAWKVVAADEDVEPMTVHPDALQKHTLQVELRGHAKAVDNIDDALHALAAQALTAIFDLTPPADALNTIASKLQVTLRRIERDMQQQGQALLGLVVITLRVDFRTRASAPETLV
jgi:hypothetical protein